ncbi:hypothetical protein LNKW23_24340 [Paralimibaculum aggregatum]|uniref:Uncharacterized protein n=1 Tax=Paralimibaculum aggregatum TaxID=3036245 RepID=A0ABQ6LIW6_9RHOB|nr:hypothetical protein LNKW23_24340 [Limibaculum sp. NKW23]
MADRAGPPPPPPLHRRGGCERIVAHPREAAGRRLPNALAPFPIRGAAVLSGRGVGGRARPESTAAPRMGG